MYTLDLIVTSRIDKWKRSFMGTKADELLSLACVVEHKVDNPYLVTFLILSEYPYLSGMCFGVASRTY